jgi:hypothetical protein
LFPDVIADDFMAGPQRQAERRPSEVQVPQLSREQIEQRAGRAFDRAVVTILGQYFRGPPPAVEMREFRRMADEAVRSTPAGQEADIGAVMDRFVRENPDSVFARYVRFTGGSTSWILSERGQIAFSQSALTRGVTEFFAPARSRTVAALVELGGNPRLRSSDVNFNSVDLVLQTRHVPPAREGEEEQVIETRAGPLLHQTFAAQISQASGQNELAATANYSNSTLLLATRLPPPDQNTDFGRGG